MSGRKSVLSRQNRDIWQLCECRDRGGTRVRKSVLSRQNRDSWQLCINVEEGTVYKNLVAVTGTTHLASYTIHQ